MRDLSREQVVMRLSGDDLEIGIKEEGKAFSGLSDVLTIKNWRNPFISWGEVCLKQA